MRLTTRGRYAVTALLDLALQPTEQTITLAEIAARQSISVAYLEQLFAKLKRHGLFLVFAVQMVVIIWLETLMKLLC